MTLSFTTPRRFVPAHRRYSHDEHFRDCRLGTRRVVLRLDASGLWQAGQLDHFIEPGLVRKGGLADATIHYDCEKHCDIGYDPLTLPNGRVAVTHRCMHGCELVVLEPERFQLSDIYFDGLAALLASAFPPAGRFAPCHSTSQKLQIGYATKIVVPNVIAETPQ